MKAGDGDMIQGRKRFVFLAGLHRSGTSLLHQIIRDHPLVSGFRDTGVPQDEGQHLQTVYPPAKEFGGPGKFAFHAGARMTEAHPLATPQAGETIFAQWRRHFDLAKEILVEKSPPNIIRTRFLQEAFPGSLFIAILRHPLAVSYATMKWSGTSLPSLLDHSFRAYEIFAEDMLRLNSVYVLRYEDFVLHPGEEISKLYRFIGIPAVEFAQEVLTDVNGKYFQNWKDDWAAMESEWKPAMPEWERRASRFGYSLERPERLSPSPILGLHGRR